MTWLKKNKIYFLSIFFLLGIIQPFFSIFKILDRVFLFDYYYAFSKSADAFLKGISFYKEGYNNYPPTILFISLPLHFIPVFLGQIVWTIFSFIALWISFFLIVKIIDLKLSKEQYLFIIPLVLLSFPVKWTFGMGQVNNFILLLIVLTMFSLKKQSNISAILLGTAIAIKITPAIFLLWFLIRRKFIYILITCLTSLAIFLLSGIFFGFELINEYLFKIVPSLSNCFGKYTYYNQAFSGVFARFINNCEIQQIFWMIFSIIIIFVSLKFLIVKKRPPEVAFSVLILLALMINAFSWQHHFVWLLIPFLTTFHYCHSRFWIPDASIGINKSRMTTLILVSYILVSFNIKNPDLFMGNFFGKLLLSHVFLGTLVLWVLLIKVKSVELIESKTNNVIARSEATKSPPLAGSR